MVSKLSTTNPVMVHNIHITLTSFRNESRMLKQIDSLLKSKTVDKVTVHALHEEGLLLKESLDNGVIVFRHKIFSRSLKRNLITQLVTFIEFLIRVYFSSRKESISIINVHSLIVLPIGYLLKKLFSAKLIYDAHELETETQGLHGKTKQVFKYLEKKIIKKCDLVVVVSKEIQKWYQNTYDISNVITVMNCPDYQTVEKKNFFREEFNISNDKRIVLYQGGLNKSRGVDLLLEAFKNNQQSQYVLVIMGYGVLAGEAEDSAKSYDNIFYKKAVDPDVLLEYTSSADIGVHWIDDSCLNHQYCMPNKLFEYLMAGLPVAVSNLIEMATFVDEKKVGVVIKTWHSEALFDALDKLTMSDLSELKENAENVSKKYNWHTQGSAYVESIKQIM